MKLFSHFNIFTAFCVLFNVQTAITQICLPLPAIDDAPAEAAAPSGYNLMQSTPDIISGNGPWPGGGGYTVFDVNGTSMAGGTMGMFLHNSGDPAADAEGWETTFTGLTIGQSYSVSCQWQQATLSGIVTYSSGNLLVTVNGIPTLFTSSGGVSDSWQIATVTFTATATTALYQFQVQELPSGTGGSYGSFIVVDNYNCPIPPSLSISVNTGSICEGQCFNLQATPTNGVGTISYNWNNGIGTTTAGPITICPTATTTYTVTAIDSSGNTSTASTTITVNPIPIVNLGNDTTVCNGTLFNLDAGNPGASYLWNNSNVSQTLPPSTSGTYWAQVNLNGCIASDTITVNLIPFQVNLGNDTILCQTPSFFLNAGNPGATYLWNDNSTNQQLTINDVGVYWVQVTQGICSAIDTIEVSIDVPALNLGPDISICASTFTLDAQNNGSTYLWHDGSTNQTFNTNSSGTYWVEVIRNGCSVTDTIEISLESISVNLGNDTTLCIGSTLVLNAQNFGSNFTWQDGSTNQNFTVSVPGTYSVNVVNGLCSSFDDININFSSPIVNLGPDVSGCNLSLTFNALNTGSIYLWQDGSLNQTFNTNVDGTYWVEVTDDNGCLTRDTVIVTHTDPIASFTLSDSIGCAPLIVEFTDLSNAGEGSITQWEWNFGDNTSSVLQNPTHNYSSSNVYTISLTVTNTQGCTNTELQNVAITVYDQPEAFFTFSPTTILVDQEVFFINQSINATNWWWEFGDSSTSSTQNPVYTYTNAGDFNAILVASNGICTDTARITVSVNEEPIYYIPNTFTPDGNEFNQTFQPVFTDGFDPYNFKMLIYNRWGEVIFESNDATVGWDGVYKDNMLVQDGTYTWKIEFKERTTDKRHLIFGNVNVIK